MGQQISDLNTKLLELNQAEKRSATFDIDNHERTRWKRINNALYSFMDEQIFNSIKNEYQTAATETQAHVNDEYAVDHPVTNALTSTFQLLIQTAEKQDRTVIEQIFNIIHQLYENLPIDYLLKERTDHELFKVFVSLFNLINQHSLINEKTLKILLGLAMATGSLKEILRILSHFLFNRTDRYDVGSLFIQLNNHLNNNIDQEKNALAASFLTSIGVFPNANLIEGKTFDGPLVVLVILIHLESEDFIPFQFDLMTINELFSIIDRLKNFEERFDSVLIYCLKLLTRQLKSIGKKKLDVDRRFDLLFSYVDDPNESIGIEASKALVLLLNFQFPSFNDRLAFLQKYLLDHRFPHLTEQCLNFFHQHSTLMEWVEHFSTNDTDFLDRIYSSSNDDIKEKIEEIFLRFQNYFFIQTKTSTSDFVQYVVYLLKKFPHRLIDSILLGLAYWTREESNVSSFVEFLPVIGQFILSKDNRPFSLWLFGRIHFVLFNGSSVTKYDETLKSILFSGGIESEENAEKEFLLSIFHRNDRGASIFDECKSKRTFVGPKSIESQATDACAAIFAVYLKYFRCVSLIESMPKRIRSIFDLASRVYSNFSMIKGQGGDCDEYYQRIKENSLFLLTTIKQSDLIPLIEHQKISSKTSHWKKTKLTFKSLRHAFGACLRFKRLISQQKPDVEHQLQQAIDTFVYAKHLPDEFEQLTKSLRCQNDRAKIRLETLRFVTSWIDDALKTSQKTLILQIFLSQLKDSDVNWSYFDRIFAANDRWKEDIADQYFYLLKILFKSLTIDDDVRDAFALLNYSYQSADFQRFYRDEFVKNLFERSNDLITFQWFRFYLEQLRTDDEQMIFIYRKLIFNEILSKRSNLDQILILLLNSIEDSSNVRRICSTSEYLKELISLYKMITNPLTNVLALKILRHLIISIPSSPDGKTSKLINEFLFELLLRRTISDIHSEEVYLYRQILSSSSPWQKTAIDLLFDQFPSDSSVDILGGFIHRIGLGSIVDIAVDEQNEHETQLAMIIEIDSTKEKPFRIQKKKTNKIEQINDDEINLIIEVSPPTNLSDLPIETERLHKLFDTCIEILRNPQSSYHRQSIALLDQIITNKTLIDIFLSRPGALSIVKDLAVSTPTSFPSDLRSSSKIHLENYFLSLYLCDETIEDDNSFTNWIDPQVLKQERTLIDVSQPSQWKRRATKREIDTLKQGRLGQDEIRLVPMPIELGTAWLVEECGTNDFFPGRIYLISENDETSFGTFGLENVQVNEGKWFFAVRLLENSGLQIGWATTGFKPSKRLALGQDRYSWSFDGSQNKLFHQEEFQYLPDGIQWQPGDVCGCGIEIESDRIIIRYWLNGRSLGTAFEHGQSIRLSDSKCNFFPNGRAAVTYFPAVSLKVNGFSMSCCEFIFSPEDMNECPLPKDYKPLLLPTIIETNSALVPYPCHAYRIDDDRNDHWIESSDDPTKSILRDFIGDQHGLPFHLNPSDRSWTISFDFQRLSSTDEKLDLILIESDSIRITSPKFDNSKMTRCAIVFDVERDDPLTIYLNEKVQRISNIPTFSILPKSDGFEVKNIGRWNYALTEESIQRLFTQGLSYVVIDFDHSPTINITNLLQIGYDENSIRKALEENGVKHPQELDTILRQSPDSLSRLSRLVDRHKVKQLMSKSNETNPTEILLKNWNEIQRSNSFDLNVENSRWFSSFVPNETLNNWLRDKTSQDDEIDETFRLVEIPRRTKSNEKTKTSHRYVHRSLKQNHWIKRRQICQQTLISINAQNLFLKIFSSNPIEDVSNSFLVTFLRLLSMTNDSGDRQRMKTFLRSIWTLELNSMLEQRQITPILFEIQKDLLSSSSSRFIVEVYQILTEFLNESDEKYLIRILFPPAIVELLFHHFLFSQSHETKIDLLHLFSTHRIQLDSQMKFFFYKLFIENPPNSTTFTTRLLKRFQISVLDIVYLLVDDQREYPSSFENLRQALKLIDQLRSINVDEHLMRLVNSHSTIDSIFTHPITDPFLSHRPLEQILQSTEIIDRFNSIILEILPLVDFNLSDGESFLTDRIRSARDLILTRVKQTVFSASLLMTEADGGIGTPTIRFDTVAASTNTKIHGQMTMFNQAFEQLFSNAQTIFRLSAERLWFAQYVGMHSSDQGGPYRDSITRIVGDICSNRLPLFILCPNARTGSGLNRDRWIPNVFSPHQSIPKRIRNQYRFVGQLMGMAIRKRHYLDLKFPRLLWKQLIGQTLTFEDIESIDSQSFTMINEIENNSQLFQNSDEFNEFLSSIFDELRFEALSSSGETFELIPGGKDRPITANNFKDYACYYRQYRLNEFRRQIDLIRQGLCSVVPGYFLNLYTAEELEEAICGKTEIDIELLKRNTNYGGDFSADLPLIQQFWTILKDRFNEEQRKAFLVFVWGRSTLPRNDEDFTSKFGINPYYIPDGQVNGVLPRSHTCSFALDLPAYSTMEIMLERLNYAISYCSSIDGDGNFNDPPNLSQLDGTAADSDGSET